MPGMLFHMMIYSRTGRPPILAVLNDIAPIAGCVRWQDTHEDHRFERLAAFLTSEGASDLVSAMRNHLAVDKSMHGPHSPIYRYMQEAEKTLDNQDPSRDSFEAPSHNAERIPPADDVHARLAELVVETSLDGVVAERDSSIFNLIERSQQALDVDRLSLLFARFYGRERLLFRECLDLLKSRNPYATSSMDDLARSFLAIYDRTVINLARLAPPEPSAPFQQCMKLWFTDAGRMEILRRLEMKAKADLAGRYEALRNLDFGDGL